MSLLEFAIATTIGLYAFLWFLGMIRNDRFLGFRGERFGVGMTREKMTKQVMASRDAMLARGIPKHIVDEKIASDMSAQTSKKNR